MPHTFARLCRIKSPMTEPRYRQEAVGGLQTAKGVEAEVIGVPEVLSADDAARWTRVTSPFMGHRNICKSQRTVMTRDCMVIG
jgi:hypothetical protein